MYNEEDIARPYARALVAAAIEGQCMSTVREDMAALQLQWEHCEALRDWCQMYHSLPREKHCAMVRELWGDTFSKPVLVLLEALAIHGLLATIPLVIRLFKRFANMREGRVHVTLTFAVEPSPTMLNTLTARARDAYGNATTTEIVIDPTIGAGCIIRAGDKQIDGSLTGRLRRLRKTFAGEE